MAETLNELKLISAVTEALCVLLGSHDSVKTMDQALELLGRSIDADHISVFENHPCPEEGKVLTSRRYSWARTDELAQAGARDLPCESFPRWMRSFEKGLPISGRLSEFPEGERRVLESPGVASIAAVPIMVKGHLWGCVMFCDGRSGREWRPEELRILAAAAAGIGGAVVWHHSEEALREANESLRKQAEELQQSHRVALSLMEDARRAEQQAELANEAKSTFLTVMSHEMRTPLSGILGFTELARAEPLPEPVGKYIGMIHRSGELLLSLISDVLDLSKIESGHLELEASTGSVIGVVRDVIDLLRRQAEEKGLVLDLEVAESVPEAVNLDLPRYRQVVMNLVGNAIKFTERGQVSMRLWTSPESSDQVRLFCRVTDTGIGIAPDAQDRIFEPFLQAHSSVHKKYGGTGLGLAISRHLCELMGGTIQLDGTKEGGAAFTFDVLARVAKTQERPEPEAGEIPQMAGSVALRVLVVDDVAANRELLKAILKRMGYAPAMAENGEQAVQRVAEETFDLVLLDVLMPGIDGCEAARRIRLMESRRGLRKRAMLVALSADAMKENRTRCLEAGMNDFLTKPINVPLLAAILRKAEQMAMSAG